MWRPSSFALQMFWRQTLGLWFAKKKSPGKGYTNVLAALVFLHVYASRILTLCRTAPLGHGWQKLVQRALHVWSKFTDLWVHRVARYGMELGCNITHDVAGAKYVFDGKFRGASA